MNIQIGGRNMKIELFTLCDYVSNNNGKLTIVNTFDALTASKFPWRAYFGVAIKIDLAEAKAENSQFAMHIHKEGDEQTRLFNVNTTIKPQEMDKLVFAGNIKGLIFAEPGVYHYVISIDDDILLDYLFTVNSQTHETK